MNENAGISTCPICGMKWLVTPYRDCLLPACGCYGDDAGPNNPHRPCERCGLTHAMSCPGGKAAKAAERSER